MGRVETQTLIDAVEKSASCRKHTFPSAQTGYAQACSGAREAGAAFVFSAESAFALSNGLEWCALSNWQAGGQAPGCAGPRSILKPAAHDGRGHGSYVAHPLKCRAEYFLLVAQ